MSGRRGRGGGGGGHDGGGGEERWLLPYSDMITLLLGLFIVLFAMSTIDARKFDNVKRSLAQTFNGAVLDGSGDVFDGSNGVLDPTSPSQAQVDSTVTFDEATRNTNQQFNQETQQLQQLVNQSGLGNDVKVTRNEVGIEVELAGDALFEPGSWALKQPGILDKLKRIERHMAAFDHPIRIIGHTDGVPYPGEWGNWGLSTNRAQAVAKYFRDLGFADTRMEVMGKGATDPAVKPPTPTASVAKNRRIEIIILEPGADDPVQNLTPAQVAATSPNAVTSRSTAPTAAEQVDAQLGNEFAEADPLTEQIIQTGRGG
ncbi:MAG: flagellar motor protein MotB [Thermoleophilia bacterium]|nr:flagellar motor protein MotB [Thermoleophilia bacterium]